MSAILVVDPPAAVAYLVDADLAAVSSEARKARAEVTVTRSTGNLVRTSDLGHSPQYLGNPLPMNVKVAGATCSVCGEEWPCASRRWEQAAVFGPSAAFVRDCVRTNLDGSVEVRL